MYRKMYTHLANNTRSYFQRSNRITDLINGLTYVGFMLLDQFESKRTRSRWREIPAGAIIEYPSVFIIRRHTSFVYCPNLKMVNTEPGQSVYFHMLFRSAARAVPTLETK